MAGLDLEDFIEVDDEELASGMSIDTSQLEEDTPKVEESTDDKTKVESKTKTEEENLIEVSDEELNDDSSEEPKPAELGNTVADKTDDKDDDTDENPFQAFTSLLQDKGVFPNIDQAELDGVTDADGIITLLNKQIGQVNNSWKDNYTQHLLQNLINDGVIKQDQLTKAPDQRYTAQEISGDEEKAKQTLQQFYASKNIPTSQIETIIDGLLDYEEEALKVLPLMEEEDRGRDAALAQRLKDRENEQMDQQNSFNDQLKNNVNGYEEFIPGRALTQQDKDDVVQRIPTVLDKINKDLGKYAPILAFLDKYEFLDGKMDKLINEAKTKNVDNFSKVLTNKKRGSTSNRGVPNKDALSGSGMPQIYK